MLGVHGRLLQSARRHLPVQGQQGSGQDGGPPGHPGPLLREADRAADQGAPGRGRRGDGPQADRVAGPAAEEAGRQAAGSGQGRAAAGERGACPRGVDSAGGAGRATRRAEGPARPDHRAGAEARPDLAGAPGASPALPHPEGDDQGVVPGGRGADQGDRGRVGHLGLDAQRRRHHAAGPGQDRLYAGARRRPGRAAGLGCARRPDPARRRHPEGARQGVVDEPGRQRVGRDESRDRVGVGWRRGGRVAGRGARSARKRTRGHWRRRRRLMAISRNIKPDRGLTYRMLMTGFFLVVLYGAVIGILIAARLSFVFVLVIAFALLFCQSWFLDQIAMYAMHAKEVTPEQAPELHGVVDRLCALADMPKPKVAIATTDIPNAFATGRSPKAAVVCATTGLLRRLDDTEVEAVLAHEISHVAHRDVALMAIASSLGVLAGLLTRVMFYAGLF